MRKLFLVITATVLLTSQSVLHWQLSNSAENLPQLINFNYKVFVSPSFEILRAKEEYRGSTEKVQKYSWTWAHEMAEEEENVILFGMTYSKVRQNPLA